MGRGVANLSYVGFLDFAGGTAHRDSAAIGIAHAMRRDGRTIAVLDLIRERRPPFSPADVCRDFAATLRAYGIMEVTSDRWGGQFPPEQMQTFGIYVTPSTRTKSEIYAALLPIINSGNCELLDNARLTAQLTALERRTGHGGRDDITHRPMAHDDVINAAAGALVLAAERETRAVAYTARTSGGGFVIHLGEPAPPDPPPAPPGRRWVDWSDIT